MRVKAKWIQIMLVCVSAFVLAFVSDFVHAVAVAVAVAAAAVVLDVEEAAHAVEAVQDALAVHVAVRPIEKYM